MSDCPCNPTIEVAIRLNALLVGARASRSRLGFDFELFGKAGLNFDVGVLWQGDPQVTLTADGTSAGQAGFESSLEAERQELEADMSDYKAYPVISLSFVYNF